MEKPKIQSKDKSFEKMWNTDCSAFIDKKDTGKKDKYGRPVELSYLSWPYAWALFRSEYPDANYEVKRFDGGFYFCDPVMGLMVNTRVWKDKESEPLEMWLPVMDGANNAMKLEPYEYTVKGKDGKIITKRVAAADMTDINKAIMRCLVKNLGMFGLGLSIYAGEDIPQPLTTDEPEPQPQEPEKKPAKEAKGSKGNKATAEPAKPAKQPANEQQQALPHITREDVLEGRLESSVTWLIKHYDYAAKAIKPQALEMLEQKATWGEGAFNELQHQVIMRLGI